MFAGGTTVVVYKLAPPGASSCGGPPYSVVSRANCAAAGAAVLPPGEKFGRRGMAVGAWKHVPSGCSLQSGGDWTIHYSTGPGNSGSYSLVCEKTVPGTPPTYTGYLQADDDDNVHTH